jgi:hypothetical protein
MGIEAHRDFNVCERLLCMPSQDKDNRKQCVSVGEIGIERDGFTKIGDCTVAVEYNAAGIDPS